MKGQYLLLKLFSLQYNILRPVILVNNLHLWPGSITPFLDECLFTSTSYGLIRRTYLSIPVLSTAQICFFIVIKVILREKIIKIQDKIIVVQVYIVWDTISFFFLIYRKDWNFNPNICIYCMYIYSLNINNKLEVFIFEKTLKCFIRQKHE